MKIRIEAPLLIDGKAHLKGEVIKNAIELHKKISASPQINLKQYERFTRKILKMIDKTDYQIAEPLSEIK